MSTTIESILATPDRKKEVEYNIITAMSKDIGRGYMDLKNTVSGWGKKKLTSKEQKWSWIVWWQITITSEQWEKLWSEKRVHNH